MLKSKIGGSVQEVILPDFPDDDNTVTTTVTKSRRVSFGTNFVKEFIVGSAVSAQCIGEYEQAFPSSDSSNADSSHSAAESEILDHSPFVPESHKVHKSTLPTSSQTAEPDSMENRPKPPKFSSTICFSADSPTADMEFTEGCITLAKSILDKKNKEMTVIIQAKPKETKDEEKPKEDETKYFDASQFEMSVTRCLKSKENKREEKRFECEKTKIYSKFEDEMSITRCNKVFSNDESDSSWEDCKENRMPLDMIMRHLDKDSSDLENDLFNPEKSFSNLLNPFDLSNESEKLNLNESMDISGDFPHNLKSTNESKASVLNDSEKAVQNDSMEISNEIQNEKSDILPSPDNKLPDSNEFEKISMDSDLVEFNQAQSDNEKGDVAMETMQFELSKSIETPDNKLVDEGVKEIDEPEEHILVENEEIADENEKTPVFNLSEQSENKKVPALDESEQPKNEKTQVLDESEQSENKKTPVLNEFEQLENEKTPVLDEPEQPENEKTPVLDGSAQPENERTPVLDESEQPKNEKTPVLNLSEQPGNKKTPVLDEPEQPENEKTPVLDGSAQPENEKTPVLNESAQLENVQPVSELMEITTELPISAEKTNESQPVEPENVESPSREEKSVDFSISKNQDVVPELSVPQCDESENLDEPMEVCEEVKIPEEIEPDLIVNKDGSMQNLEDMEVSVDVQQNQPEPPINEECSNIQQSFTEVNTPEEDEIREPSLVDIKVVESLKEQSKEPGCVWSLKEWQHPHTKTPGFISVNFELLESATTVRFTLKASKENHLGSCSIVTGREMYLNEEKQCTLAEYELVIGFGFRELKKFFDERRQVETIRHIPYFLDEINSFMFRMNSYLKEIHSILALYPGSRLKGSLLSFRLYSFPIFFSCVVSVDLTDLFRLSKSCLSFEYHFGCLDENEIRNIFQECLKRENPLVEFVIQATKYLIELEKESGFISRRSHIRLLPVEMKL